MPSRVFDLSQVLGSAQQANQKTASCFLEFMSLWHLPLGILELYRNGLIIAVVALNRAWCDSRQLGSIPKSALTPGTHVHMPLAVLLLQALALPVLPGEHLLIPQPEKRMHKLEASFLHRLCDLHTYGEMALGHNLVTTAHPYKHCRGERTQTMCLFKGSCACTCM